MSDNRVDIEQLSINTIRTLSMDAVQKANSGHPGMPMGMAPIAYALFYKSMKHNPLNSKWLNRDRFVLSGGHGSMLLYSILHLSGYKISLDDLKNFRQWNSKTPGHPELGHTDGVETTTGPLGQGFATAIGMAIARDYLAAMFNKDDIKIIDHGIWGMCGDGDLMEGISHEAASLAGHLKLGKFVFFYDDNQITIDGSTSISCSDDVARRFEAYGWQVLTILDVNDSVQVDRVIKLAKSSADKPTLIISKSHIGYGSPNKQDKSAAHGAPLGEEEIKLTKKYLGMPDDISFYVPEEVYSHFKGIGECGQEAEDLWNKQLEEYKIKYPKDYELYVSVMSGNYPNDWIDHLPKFEDYTEKISTRVVSGKVLNAAVIDIPTLIGGSADLNESNMTHIKSSTSFSAVDKKGKNIHFGIREHAMGAVLNGMSIYGGIIPFGATFLIFSDYMRPATIQFAGLGQREVLFQFVLAGQQRGRRTAQRLPRRSHRDLLQFAIVNPDFFTVADDQLRVRLLNIPAQLSRSRDRHRACRLLRFAAATRNHDLREIGLERPRLLQKAMQLVDRPGFGQQRKNQGCCGRQQFQGKFHSASRRASTSRPPRPSIDDTSPAFSIASMRRAERL